MKAVLFILVLLAFLSIVGKFDLIDEENETRIYCDMVKDGVWPDYKGIYEKECGE